MNDNSNFILAITLSILILMGFHWFYEVPRQKAALAKTEASKILTKEEKPEVAAAPRPRADILASDKRVRFENAVLHGSMNLKGARLDDVTLRTYRETTDKNSAEVILLSPAGTAAPSQPYYAEFGWLAAEGTIKLPSSDSIWRASKDKLGAGESVTLTWDNGEGLIFERDISLDDAYMFKVTERVRNSGKDALSLYPFALISRHGTPHTLGYSVLHEGPLGVLDGQLKEFNYKKLKETPLTTINSTGGWAGMTDVYWLTSLIPDQKGKVTARFIHSAVGGQDRYQTDMQGEVMAVPAGGTAEKTFHFFAGAKEVAKLDAYGKDLNIPMFDKAVDFGWFYFIAKPFFHLLHFLATTLGNYGLAIIAFTVLLRLVFYPLSETSYRSMARMRDLQPEMNRLKERYGNDPMKMNEEVTALYKKEKLNPLAGCLPIFIQIPVFFALYKVLLVAIEMRHAPFYGWVKDLSAPDPTNLFTLFGLLPFDAPSWLHLGAWPLLMGATMYLQQLLAPPQQDKTMQQVFMFLPIMFTFMLAGMSSGLVIYWTLSNALAIAQQTLINHRTKKKA